MVILFGAASAPSLRTFCFPFALLVTFIFDRTDRCSGKARQGQKGGPSVSCCSSEQSRSWSGPPQPFRMPSDTLHRPPPLVTVSGALVSYLHTVCGLLAFGGALFVALSLHYHKVVKNGVAGWPHEYWPSVSATIGDWYPERNLFQIGIALMSGPRFLLVMLSSMLVSLSKPTSMHARILLTVGILRTFACGGWVYVTSTDDHDVHDVMMGAYLLLTPPWMLITSGSLAVQPNKNSLVVTSSRDALADKARKMRRIAASAFFGMIPFMIFFFYRHKVLEIPGAYTHYAFFEWGLIIFVSYTSFTGLRSSSSLNTR